LHPSIDLQFVGPSDKIPPCDLIVLPGSKAVRQDLTHLKEVGWDVAIRKHLRYGGKVLGICGGYQMLGERIDDPDGIEGAPGSSEGLGLLSMETVLEPVKTLKNVSGKLQSDNAELHGYEIHMGVSQHAHTPFAALSDAQGKQYDDGACSADDLVRGTYVHGVFDSAATQQSLLSWAGFTSTSDSPDYAAIRNAEIDRLADTLESHLNIDILAEFFTINPANATKNKRKS